MAGPPRRQEEITMTVHDQAARHHLMTECGREIVVGRLPFGGGAHPAGRVTLDVGLRDYDRDEAWLSLTAAESRRLAAHLLAQAAAVERRATPPAEVIEVAHAGGEAYAIAVRQHPLLCDQGPDLDGDDSAGTPTELFVASLAACAAFYAGRYLDRHGLPRDGLRVTAGYILAADRPARVAEIRLRVSAPGVPEQRRAGLLAVASHCTVHNSLRQPPEVTVELA
ncbi:OsmC family protein [Actinomadura sp. ATCC 31491]|uniref:OsmC family protein n=1 Tax=Actinomadura luzonensis TaxID=2805427 RepID=A0ABT0FQ09_9ACTN|nr:OsmC family protein [Actinomadura luzonensis]MCK2214434.1 OsmC family protein [Actinomadura luzonensis]